MIRSTLMHRPIPFMELRRYPIEFLDDWLETLISQYIEKSPGDGGFFDEILQSRAGDGIRTHDIVLGKHAFYH